LGQEIELNHNIMLSKISLLVFFISAVTVGSFAQTSERDLVFAAIQNYVDALYLVKPEKIKESVHPGLTKKGYWRKSAAEPFGPEQTMTWQQLYDLAGKWNSKGNLPANAPKVIEIFDVQDQTASAKLTAQWGTDYFQLAKYDGKWMIVNVLWQSPSSNVVAEK
jgi:hypothetical protein